MKRKRKRGEQPLRFKTPCHVCGSLAYEWGWTYKGTFRHGKPIVINLFRRPVRILQARCCTQCGNVQLFTPPDWTLYDI